MQRSPIILGLCSVALFANLAQAERISGSVPDLRSAMSTSGMTVNFQFSRIGYQATVGGVELIEHSGDQAELELTLRDILLTVGSTSLRGSVFSANVGPLPIRLASQRPVRIRYTVNVDDGNLHLIETNLTLSNVDMQVGNPASVRTSGFGATRSRVVSGLRDGISRNRASIEEILQQEATNIFRRAEHLVLAKLPLTDSGTAIADSRNELAPNKTTTIGVALNDDSNAERDTPVSDAESAQPKSFEPYERQSARGFIAGRPRRIGLRSRLLKLLGVRL